MDNGTIAVDSVVVAVGYEPNNKLAESLKTTFEKVYTIGDAKSPRRVLDATSEGFEAANQL